MSEGKGGFDRYLEPGLIVSVRAEGKLEVAAIVSSVLEDLISLELVPDGSGMPFQEGDHVQLRFWNQEVTAYHWSAEVGKLFPEQNLVTLSTQDARSCREGNPTGQGPLFPSPRRSSSRPSGN